MAGESLTSIWRATPFGRQSQLQAVEHGPLLAEPAELSIQRSSAEPTRSRAHPLPRNRPYSGERWVLQLGTIRNPQLFEFSRASINAGSARAVSVRTRTPAGWSADRAPAAFFALPAEREIWPRRSLEVILTFTWAGV